MVVLRGGGSTFVKPILEHWSELYLAKTGKKVEYTAAGSSKGIEGVLSGFLDFACSDAPLSDNQLKISTQPILHIPLVMGAVVPTYNVVNESAEPINLRFTGPVLAQIYLGKITSWNDPAITANNPGLELPDLNITVVTRSDGSGTTNIFTEYLSKASSAWKLQVGQGNLVKWPVGIQAEKNNGVADMVSRTPGSIGYVEYSYALSNNLPIGSVKNRQGSYVMASSETITQSAAGMLQEIPEDLRFSLTDSAGTHAYPIVGTSWAVLHEDQKDDKVQELVDFLTWVTHDGQDHVSALHYGKLPASLVEKIQDSIQKIH
jgi:eukaryotic-like serine/threonine-protein kinase